MIDFVAENLEPLTILAATLPTKPHITTLLRWHKKGIRGVKLETKLIGGRRYCSREALNRFIDRLSAV